MKTSSAVARLVVLMAALSVNLCVITRLDAQTLTGTILGTVLDQSHAVIPNAQVSLTQMTTNARRTAPTNDAGFYSFANLDPGTYRVEIEHTGFRRVVRADIVLAPNTTVRVDAELQPGVVSE